MNKQTEIITEIPTVSPQEIERTHVLDALKMLSDWSKWSVTVQTALIAAIGLVLKPSDQSSLKGIGGGLVVFFGILAVLCFMRSIFCASFLLLSIPGKIAVLATWVNPKDELYYQDDQFLLMPAYDRNLFYYVRNQYLAFVWGLGLFSAFAILLLIGIKSLNAIAPALVHTTPAPIPSPK